MNLYRKRSGSTLVANKCCYANKVLYMLLCLVSRRGQSKRGRERERGVIEKCDNDKVGVVLYRLGKVDC